MVSGKGVRLPRPRAVVPGCNPLAPESPQDLAHRREGHAAAADDKETGRLELGTSDPACVKGGRPAVAESPERDRPAQGGDEDVAV